MWKLAYSKYQQKEMQSQVCQLILYKQSRLVSLLSYFVLTSYLQMKAQF